MKQTVRLFLVLAAIAGLAQPGTTATFIVPDDETMARQSDAIVRATVMGSTARTAADGLIWTLYDVRVEEQFKGEAGGAFTLHVPGGAVGSRFLSVSGTPGFTGGEEVILFLVREENRWQLNELTLGAFQKFTDRTGQALWARDAEGGVFLQPNGLAHVERGRSDLAFQRALRARNGGRPLREAEYMSSSPVIGDDDSEPATREITANATYPPHTYSQLFNSSPSSYPGRRETFGPSGTPFHKSASQNLQGAADGGAAAIQSGLAAWTNDCGSAVNLVYGGTTSASSVADDGVNMVLFNDPHGNISGSWSGSGTVALTFSWGSHLHNFAGVQWVNISESDIVFQNGYTASAPSVAPAMTHEIGHALGIRHSNGNGGVPEASCNSSTQDCSSSAIMAITVNAAHGYNLQPWDQRAVRAIYPGGTCPVTSTNVRGDFNGDGHVDLLWRNYSTGAVNVWFMNRSTYTGGTNLFNVADPSWQIQATADFSGDGKSDIVWRNYATGAVNIWFMNGTTYTGGATLFSVADPNWRIEAAADFNNDGHPDLIWRNYSTGAVNVWFMNRTTYVSGASLFNVADPNWRIEAAADFSGDGRPDLVWRNYSTGDVNIWFMNGTTYTGGANMFRVTDPAWNIEAVGDYNGDGKNDLVWRNYSSGAVNVWYLDNTRYISGATLTTVADPNWKIEGPR